MVEGFKECTAPDHSLVAEALQPILSSIHFRKSKRYPAFLEYSVQHSLAADFDALRERVIGNAVFGRIPDYDTNEDPVVRIVADEVRKRLAQYYRDTPEVKLHLEIPVGSYATRFYFSAQQDAPGPVLDSVPPVPEPTSTTVSNSGLTAWFRRHRRLTLGCALAFLLLALAGLTLPGMLHSTEYLLWQPLMTSRQELLMVVDSKEVAWNAAISVPAAPSSSVPPRADAHLPAPASMQAAVLLQDAASVSKLVSRLSYFEQAPLFRSSSDLTMRDFRGRPVILIGSFSNSWTSKLLSHLHYSIQLDPVSGDRWIQNAQTPGARPWMIAGSTTASNVDYALITRFWDVDTGGWVMALSGLGANATGAAVDLLTAPSLRQVLPSSLRRSKNFQIVLSVSVVNETVGTPRILDLYQW